VINSSVEFDAAQADCVDGALMSNGLSEPTGRHVVVLADAVQEDEATITAALQSVAGVLTIANASDFADGGVEAGHCPSEHLSSRSRRGMRLLAGARRPRAV
jgi:hypothetical protein